MAMYLKNGLTRNHPDTKRGLSMMRLSRGSC